MTRLKYLRTLPKRQRGVALIIALLVFSLTTVMSANLVWERGLFARRVSNSLQAEQAMHYALGAEAWAIDILSTDSSNSDTDHLNEDWARNIEPLFIDGGQIQGFVEDMQGRFNINNLVKPDGTVDEIAVAQFERLLQAVDLDSRWARIAADWIDTDREPGFPSGAEDGIYTALNPPYRPGNVPLTTPSELIAMPEFTLDKYYRIQPYLATLPVGTRINVNTASGILLQALSENISTLTSESLLEQREDEPFEDISELADYLDEDALETVDVASSFFRLTAIVQLGTTQFTMYSLLERRGTGQLTPVLRTFGIE